MTIGKRKQIMKTGFPKCHEINCWSSTGDQKDTEKLTIYFRKQNSTNLIKMMNQTNLKMFVWSHLIAKMPWPIGKDNMIRSQTLNGIDSHFQQIVLVKNPYARGAYQFTIALANLRKAKVIVLRKCRTERSAWHHCVFEIIHTRSESRELHTRLKKHRDSEIGFGTHCNVEPPVNCQPSR